MSKQHVGRVASIVGAALLVSMLAFVALTWWDSRIPQTYSVMSQGAHDYGGGAVPPDHGAHGGGISVIDLHGPSATAPDVRFQLTARAADIRLSSGRIVHALTFNGTSPGPELRARVGDLVEVVLRNDDVGRGVSVHWHGLDVPNAEDGVAGVTQDAVLPGGSHTYRFRAEQVGTFWYHTHQVSSEEVQRGLYGALVIEPREKQPGVDLVAAAHTYDGILTLNRDESGYRERVPAGTPVRIRLVNTDSVVHRFAVWRTPFRVLAIDGTELNDPGELENVALEVAAGGRLDVGYVQPSRIVQVGLVDGPQISLGPRAGPASRGLPTTSDFDPLSYGKPAATPFSASSRFDRRFDLKITKKLGFLDGRPGRQWAINGKIYPDVPMFVVEKGDLVEMTISNETDVVHPMHLHGHHALVLSRNGVAASGSPWWVDTLNVDPGDQYVVAFRADNPGLWMDHCHNLGHAAAGLTMHLAYAGVTTPYLVGGEHDNAPE